MAGRMVMMAVPKSAAIWRRGEGGDQQAEPVVAR